MKWNNNSQWQLGYAKESERKDEIDAEGQDPEQILVAMRAAYPTFNPYAKAWNRLFWQGQQGACQGHALAHAAQVMGVQKFGQLRYFSRACGYYEAQRFDGLNGDKGSTLAGGRKVLSGDGLMLETDWPYPSRYNNRRPANFPDAPRIRVDSSKQVRDADLIFDLLEAGAAIQTGLTWNSSCDQAVATRYQSGGGGGHSTLLYGLDKQTGYAVHHNSWRNWNGDGRSLWSKDFIKGVLQRDRWCVFMAYQAIDVEADSGIFDAPAIT